MVIRLLKLIDRLVGYAITAHLSPVLVQPFSYPRRLLLIRPGGIGDAALLTQCIKHVININATTHITVLAEQRNLGVFQLIPYVGKVWCYDRPQEFLQAVRGRYDVVIDTEQWYHLSAVVARLVHAPVKIGFETNERRRMFTHGIPYDFVAHETDNFMALLKPLGVDCQCNAEDTMLEVPRQSESRATQLLQPLCSDQFIVIFPGSSVPEKCWGAERFAQVAKRLAADGHKVVVVGGREDRYDGDTIVGDVGLNLAGMTTVPETAAVVARSNLVISGDSGVLHIAAGLGIATVSLFGPSSASKWAPKGKGHVVLNSHLPCSPCSKFGTIPPCPINVRCMKEITPEAVLDAARRLLSQPPVQCQ